MSRNVPGMDRISGLPDQVIDQIFSFMDMKDVVHTCILSKRWRYLWKSTPYLSFNLYCDERNENITFSGEELIHFIDRVLILRNSFEINKFFLVCHEEYLDPDYLYTWLIGALGRHVQHLHLCFITTRPLELPHHLFTSEVVVLIFFNNNYDFYIPMPISMCSAARIRVMQLGGVRLPDGNLDGELLLSYPVLENLSLHRCDHRHLKSLTVSALVLKELKLSCEDGDGTASCAIDICSPNLTSLVLGGCIYKDFSLGNYSSLESVDIWISFEDSQMGREVYDKCLIKVFKAISNAKALTLANSFLEDMGIVLTKTGEVQESDMSFQCAFSRLETVYVSIYHGLEDELKFLKFLLERAKVLKKVSIRTYRKDIIDTAELREKLLALPRTSSSAMKIHIL